MHARIPALFQTEFVYKIMSCNVLVFYKLPWPNRRWFTLTGATTVIKLELIMPIDQYLPDFPNTVNKRLYFLSTSFCRKVIRICHTDIYKLILNCNLEQTCHINGYFAACFLHVRSFICQMTIAFCWSFLKKTKTCKDACNNL